MAMDAENMANIALRTAERKAQHNDYKGAKKFALRAPKAFPSLKNLDAFLAAYDVHLAFESSKLVDGTTDWRAVLLADRSADLDALKKQYKKMCLLTHPDKNSSVAAEGAFKLVKEAWSTLSSSSTYAAQATVPSPPPPPAATSYCWAPRRAPPGGSRRSHVLVVVCRHCQTLNTFVASRNGKYSISCARCTMQTPQTVVGIGSGLYPY